MEKPITAAALQANREQVEAQAKNAYEERYLRCVAEIERISKSHTFQQYTIFAVPTHLLGDPPNLSREQCLRYVIDSVRKLGFYVQRCKDEKLFISWDPQHTPERQEQKTKKVRRNHYPSSSDDDDDDVITYRPNSQFGDLFLRSQLMSKNPKYAHHARRR